MTVWRPENVINLSDEQKKAIKDSIHAFYLDEHGEDIGIIHQEGLLDLFMEQLAPVVYNKALDDANQGVLRSAQFNNITN